MQKDSSRIRKSLQNQQDSKKIVKILGENCLKPPCYSTQQVQSRILFLQSILLGPQICKMRCLHYANRNFRHLLMIRKIACSSRQENSYCLLQIQDLGLGGPNKTSRSWCFEVNRKKINVNSRNHPNSQSFPDLFFQQINYCKALLDISFDILGCFEIIL